MSLHKLWSSNHTQTTTTIDWDYAKWNSVIETVVDGAYTKVNNIFLYYSKNIELLSIHFYII